MAQQTAVEWFLQELIRCGWFKEGQINITLEQAKKIEKEQIMKAWKESEFGRCYSHDELMESAEQYYNETYGENKD